jgi:hypothetical protein
MNENPPLTAAALITAADAVRTAVARDDRLARQAAVADQLRRFAGAAGVTAEQMDDFARTMQYLAEQQNRHALRSIIYTNRAARRARARAERRRA